MFYDLIIKYKWEIVLTICLFSNLYPYLPQLLYYIVWGGFVIAIRRYHAEKSNGRFMLTMLLIGVIVFSTLINGGLFEYRWIMMCIILYITLAKTSYEFYKFKDRFLFVSFLGFTITGPLNWYAHQIGYNYQLISGLHAGELFTIDFSGYTNHPMWLSAACGIGSITLVYWANYFWINKKILFSILILPIIFITLQTLVWGGSRSAFGISLGTSLLYVWLVNKSIGKSFLVIVFMIGIASFAIPKIMEDSERMQSKQGGMNLVDENGVSSRTALWSARIEEFNSSPLWGIGFAATGLDRNSKFGRVETGSGWLTVLSQTGLIGFLIVIAIVKRSFVPLWVLRQNHHMSLYLSILIFMYLHTLFEAYLFQSGWYLCLILWTLVSLLDDYKVYYDVEDNDE